jgi:molybdopterin synthase catalytic subunit
MREQSLDVTAVPLASSFVNPRVKAVAWLIDELKAKVPIWKKEVFEGGEVWKENAESRLLAQRSQ